MGVPEGASEIRTLREVPRAREHCGKRMKRLAPNLNATGRKLVTYYVCEACGAQEREESDA